MFVVPHDSPLNTYGLMELCRLVLIYGTKTGVGLTPLGQPVVVAADAWIRGKGLTIDPSSKEEYQRLLDDLMAIEPLDTEITSRARRYAYHYFFRRMIPLSSVAAGRSDVELDITSVEELLDGAVTLGSMSSATASSAEVPSSSMPSARHIAASSIAFVRAGRRERRARAETFLLDHILRRPIVYTGDERNLRYVLYPTRTPALT